MGILLPSSSRLPSTVPQVSTSTITSVSGTAAVSGPFLTRMSPRCHQGRHLMERYLVADARSARSGHLTTRYGMGQRAATTCDSGAIGTTDDIQAQSRQTARKCLHTLEHLTLHLVTVQPGLQRCVAWWQEARR